MKTMSFPSNVENIDTLHSFLKTELEGEKILSQIISAVHEIFVNSVLYGENKTIQIETEKTANYIMISISDNSKGFLVQEELPPYNKIKGKRILYRKFYSGDIYANIISSRVIRWDIALKRHAEEEKAEEGMGLFIAKMFTDEMFYIFDDEGNNKMVLIWKK